MNSYIKAAILIVIIIVVYLLKVKNDNNNLIEKAKTIHDIKSNNKVITLSATFSIC